MHECSLVAVCTGVHKKKGREVAFDSPRSQTCGDRRKKLSNDRNSRQKLIIYRSCGTQFIASTVTASERFIYSTVS